MIPTLKRINEIRGQLQRGEWDDLAVLLAHLEANCHEQGILDERYRVVEREDSFRSDRRIPIPPPTQHAIKPSGSDRPNPLEGLDFTKPLDSDSDRKYCSVSKPRHCVSDSFMREKVC